MDWNHISVLLGIVHAAQDVDPWWGDQARRELNKLKAEATKPAPAPQPRVIPTPVERRA